MKILVIGGTIFLGKHVVAEALRRGYEVTLFNRGKHNPEMFPDVEKIRGDRLSDLKLLAGKTFDTVIDTCGYFPRAVRISAEYLKELAPHYTFISSISVYKDFSKKGLDEYSETATIEDESTEEVTGETYGALKRLCEMTAENIYGSKALIIRPGLIVGEDDPSDRFTYWVHRVADGGRIAVPDSLDRPVQFIDVKDLSSFILDLSGKGTGGIFNATGPENPLTFGDFLKACSKVAGTAPEFVMMSEEFIEKHNIEPYTELPLWVPESWSGTDHTNISKAVSAGLRFSPLEKTISETLDFDRKREGYQLRSGISREKETELIRELESDEGI